MPRVSTVKKMEALEAVEAGTPEADVAKKAGVKVETLQAWKGKPKLKVVRSLKVRGRVRLPKEKGPRALLTPLDVERQLDKAVASAARLPAAQWAPLGGESATVLKAMALMWKSGLPVGAFKEALALLEG